MCFDKLSFLNFSLETNYRSIYQTDVHDFSPHCSYLIEYHASGPLIAQETLPWQLIYIRYYIDVPKWIEISERRWACYQLNELV